MLGFMAEYAGGAIAVDGDEILEAGWFRADALPQVPPPLSIARKLIDAWVSEVTGRAAAR
jgi:NAD+ diphosphatase